MVTIIYTLISLFIQPLSVIKSIFCSVDCLGKFGAFYSNTRIKPWIINSNIKLVSVGNMKCYEKDYTYFLKAAAATAGKIHLIRLSVRKRRAIVTANSLLCGKGLHLEDTVHQLISEEFKSPWRGFLNTFLLCLLIPNFMDFLNGKLNGSYLYSKGAGHVVQWCPQHGVGRDL